MMKKITIARALKEKNRLVGEINRLYRLICSNNMKQMIVRFKEEDGYKRPADEELKKLFKIDPIDLKKKWDEARSKLIALKAAIVKANAGAAEILVELAELKSVVNTFDSMTGEDCEIVGSDNARVTVVAFKTEDSVAWFEETTKRINELQDKIDEYNATTFIEVDL